MKSEELISFEVAKLAKEKGFSWNVNYCFTEEGELAGVKMGMGGNPNFFGSISAPTQAFLQKWLREEHKIFANADISPMSGNYEWFIHNILDHNIVTENYAPLMKESDGHDYVTYEDAFEQGLLEALNLIKLWKQEK